MCMIQRKMVKTVIAQEKQTSKKKHVFHLENIVYQNKKKKCRYLNIR